MSNENEARKAGTRRRGRLKLARRMNRLVDSALDTLEQIMKDESVKPADRLSAAKLAFDVANRHEADRGAEPDGPIRVIFEGAPPEWGD